jgi:hypothetical protein
MSKILGIGLPRTGTYSLSQAFKILGHSTKHYPEKIEDISNYNACSEVRFDIIDLLEMYPDSKFVYTHRNIEDWLVSCSNHSRHYQEGWNPFWLKSPSEWRLIHKERQQSLTAVSNLLLLNICKGEGWEKLCPFLGVEVPKINFPFTNQSYSYFSHIKKSQPIKIFI